MGGLEKPLEESAKRYTNSRNVWIIFGLMGSALLFTGIFHQMIQFSLPKDFDLRVHLTSGSLIGTGSMVALVYTAGALGQLSCGRLADSLSDRKIYFCLFLILIPLVVLASQLSEIPLVLIMMVVVFISTGSLPVENTLLARYAPSNRHGLVFGSKFLLGFGFSSIGIYLSGWIFDTSGSFLWLYFLLAFLSIAVSVIAFFLPREKIFQTIKM